MKTFEESFAEVFPKRSEDPLHLTLPVALRSLMERLERDKGLKEQIASSEDLEQLLCLEGICSSSPLDAMYMAFHTGLLVGIGMERNELPTDGTFARGAHA